MTEMTGVVMTSVARMLLLSNACQAGKIARVARIRFDGDQESGCLLVRRLFFELAIDKLVQDAGHQRLIRDPFFQRPDLQRSQIF
jgi:hypothetical protein